LAKHPPQGAERGVLRELRVDGVLRSSLDRRGLDLTFEDPPLGYEILDTDQRRKGSGPEKAPTRLLTGGKSYMADDKLNEKLADYVEDAHAMEQNDLKMLDSMISTTDDPEVREMIENHKRETEEHERRLRERLEALGRGTSARKQAQAVGAALLKGVGDKARGDKAGKNARDGYMAEHLEIAAYQLLERLAEKAGDTQTAEVARQNRSDEEEMARRIDQSWDRTLELTLEENGIRV
jgi:ferritin-like metal-binding protein YciE